eukprot:TRINITY_DN1608_c1_g1_i2.p1 TRINITY_DN1608_c1_g1~~TRINITY_DN1608_c1_g1_i2.p1  ORF type:complete len:234 (+),score=31.02 TRINITY_DN1608_c1_g1_i2:428-1129(+)
MVAGVRVVGAHISHAEVNPDGTFEKCPWALAVDIPLVVKREAPSGEKHDFYRISKFMTDPKVGIAHFGWQYGGVLHPAPPVVIARTDGMPFGCSDFTALEDFMDSYTDEYGDEAIMKAPTRLDFCRFLADECDCDRSFTCFLDLRFPKDVLVQARNLQAQHMNGLIGIVTGEYRGDRVGVLFPPPHGLKSVKPQNLMPYAGQTVPVQIHSGFTGKEKRIVARNMRAQLSLSFA